MSDETSTNTAEYKRIAMDPEPADHIDRPGMSIRVIGSALLEAHGIYVVLFTRAGTREWMTLTEWRQWLGAIPADDVEPVLLPETPEAL